MQNQAQGQQTGTRNETYDVIAILYHALQGAENCQTYLKDAQDGQIRVVQDGFPRPLRITGPEDERVRRPDIGAAASCGVGALARGIGECPAGHACRASG